MITALTSTKHRFPWHGAEPEHASNLLHSCCYSCSFPMVTSLSLATGATPSFARTPVTLDVRELVSTMGALSPPALRWCHLSPKAPSLC